ncbi:5'/3'-nucleotidase SurE [Veillonella montpellierensis]|uniref:5'/3'-nucleotidase SurE n=1 Tax=Veillonella montpellierensis TaxID=187328 RepID=UPI000402A012|nr:5'/3'-nucleotidase SurE [Veillonella montpellierensis]
MHILMTNDDGVEAKGLRDLADYLAKRHRVTVIAPAMEQSAKSHALTIDNPIHMKKIFTDRDALKIYSLTGTPTDCAKFALSYYLMEDMPDLFISGINHGYNLGSDAIYSGTIGAAMEGLFYGIPSLALSVEKYNANHVSTLFPFIETFITKFFLEHDYKGLLNVNIPYNGPYDWSRVRIASQGYQKYVNIIDPRIDTRGRNYFWVAGTVVKDFSEEDSDVYYSRNDMITVVPLTWAQEDIQGKKILKEIIKYP